ncbi:MAG: nitrate reductase cytochrome c-type subunit [Spirochaetia bacterium]|nr:nitrate reductase cytochrome c-type subunit [Spirochaetia bacterium]
MLKLIFKAEKILFINIFLLSFVFLAGMVCSQKNDRAAYVNQRAKSRAYEGAPPVIPHFITKSGTRYCLSCHGKGIVFEREARVMNQKNALSKITPHPTWVNCLQCHVIQNDVRLFHKNKFKTFRLAHPEKIAKTGEEVAPPLRPHQEENRENCVVCHLSKTADSSIIPKHGMMEGCEACHMVPESLDIYQGDPE